MWVCAPALLVSLSFQPPRAVAKARLKCLPARMPMGALY